MLAQQEPAPDHPESDSQAPVAAGVAGWHRSLAAHRKLVDAMAELAQRRRASSEQERLATRMGQLEEWT